ncbi:hypothetical protein [Pandoraea sp. SD6-2]|uniref:hypothetical protein n=1 Tax=Pandoraea sp. SD6-2 TaxID=1286093 RepID=UPI0003A24137|nr:hypothetical protein [Pandoraea sp. SD6-2]
MTESDSLDYGIEYPAGSGQLHYDFTIRLATVEDNINAYEHPSIIGGGVSNMRVNAALVASCLVSLGTIPKEAITPELIGTAVDGDFDRLWAAQEVLKKKRKRVSATSATSGAPSSSSAPAASPKPESAN